MTINNSFQDKIKLQQVRLMVELFSCDPEPSFVKSCQSEIITNSKSKECGPLQLHDINPAASCTKGATKVFILSVFKLVRPLSKQKMFQTNTRP